MFSDRVGMGELERVGNQQGAPSYLLCSQIAFTDMAEEGWLPGYVKTGRSVLMEPIRKV
jgi:hypothetical protein